MSLHRNHPPGLTWVGRMPCLIPVLCVPVPITPAAATSETAPRLRAKGLGEHLNLLLGTADIPKQHKERILPHPFAVSHHLTRGKDGHLGDTQEQPTHASHSLGQGQPVLAQLHVQIREEDAAFHRHLLLLLVHLQGTGHGDGQKRSSPWHAAPPEVTGEPRATRTQLLDGCQKHLSKLASSTPGKAELPEGPWHLWGKCPFPCLLPAF